jgi:regulator of replication initiation timing
MALEEEIRILRQDVRYIKEVLAELVEDSMLTSEEEEMVREARGAVGRYDLSDFVTAEEL